MRAEELRAELAAAAARVPEGHTSLVRMVEARARRAAVVKGAVAVVAVAAVGSALVLGSRAAEAPPAASVAAPLPTSEVLSTAGRLVIPGVHARIAAVGIG